MLAGNKKYVTASLTTDKLAKAFLQKSTWLISPEEHASPEVVLVAICDKLKNDDFMPYGAMGSIESIVSRSKSSVLIPQTIAGKANARDILSASAASYLEDPSDFESNTWFIDGTDDKVDRHFSSAKEFLEDASSIFSDGKTDFVVLSLPTESAVKAIELLDTAIAKFTSGKYIAGVISKASELGNEYAEESAPAARKLLATGLAALATPALTENTLRITPAILLGLILSFVMFIFLYVGFCGMMDMGVNDQFWDKDKADKGRPLMGKVED